MPRNKPICIILDTISNRFFRLREGMHAGASGTGSEPIENPNQLISEISRDMTELLLKNQEGEIDQECIRQRSLQVSKLSQALLEVALAKEVDFEGAHAKIVESLDLVLKDILSDC